MDGYGRWTRRADWMATGGVSVWPSAGASTQGRAQEDGDARGAVHGYSRDQPGGKPVRRNSSVRSARALRACSSSSVSTCSLTLICTGMPW